MREKNRLGKIGLFGKVERLRVREADESPSPVPRRGSDFNDYRDRAGCRRKSLEELEIFCDSFFNFRRKTVIMNLDFPRFWRRRETGGALARRVAARRETKRQVEQDFLRFESARRLAASRDFNVGVGVCVGVGLGTSLARRRGGAARTTAFVRSCI